MYTILYILGYLFFYNVIFRMLVKTVNTKTIKRLSQNTNLKNQILYEGYEKKERDTYFDQSQKYDTKIVNEDSIVLSTLIN